MCRTATEDEEPEHQEHPMECEVGALAHEVDQRDRNEVIRHGDDDVGDGMEPDDLGVPEKADAVRHEIRRKEAVDEVNYCGGSLFLPAPGLARGGKIHIGRAARWWLGAAKPDAQPGAPKYYVTLQAV